MKRSGPTSLGIMACAIISLTIAAYLQTPTLASQLLLNGGFEEGGPTPDHWQQNTQTGGTLARDASQSRNGGYSAALTSSSLTPKWVYQTVTVTGGNPYVLTGYALKNDSQEASVYLKLVFYAESDGTGSVLSEPRSSELTADNPLFQLLTVGPVTAPSQARSARVMAVLQPSSIQQATVYFDDFLLEGEVFTPTPSPTSTPLPAPAPSQTFTPLPTPTPTATSVPPPAPAQTATPLPTITPTPAPTATPSPTPVPGVSSPVPTPPAEGHPTPTSSSSPTPSNTPPATATPAGPSERAPSPLLSEVMAYPAQGSEAGDEWIELYNPADQTVELAGWFLADNYSLKDLPRVTVSPGSYAVVAGSVEHFLAAYPAFTGALVGSPGRRIGNGLSNEADMLTLRSPSGEVADSVNWGSPEPYWPGYQRFLWDPGLSPPPPGRSLARLPGTWDPVSFSAWGSSLRPTPGQANAAPERTPTPTAPMGSPGTSAQLDRRVYLPALLHRQALSRR